MAAQRGIREFGGLDSQEISAVLLKHSKDPLISEAQPLSLENQFIIHSERPR